MVLCYWFWSVCRLLIASILSDHRSSEVLIPSTFTSISALLNDWSSRNLVDCGMRKNKLDYELIMEHLFGKVGFYAVIIFMFLCAYG